MPVGFGDDPSTRRAQAEDLRRVRLVGARWTLGSGPDAGLTGPIGPGGVVVGSGAMCDVRLRDPKVSRRHLELYPDTNGVRVVDAGSLNGTYFSGARIRELTLAASTSLTVGDTLLAVDLLAEPLEVEVSLRTAFGGAIAHSRAMRHVFELLERAAAGDATILLEGESGTGKEVLAHAVHQESQRRDGPFVVVDCGAIPENLIESELFGHEKGAFTGAIAARAGAFEQAERGTVFLDEIGELPLDAQPKLLRALENRSFRRVGGTRPVSVDVRVIAATNRRLRDAARRREFREDLFYRLAVVHVTIPRLSERRQDVLPLAELFLRRMTGQGDATVPQDLARLLLAYDWPGNARELRNVVERYATFARADAALLFGGAVGSGDGAAAQGIDLAALQSMPYHEAKRRLVDAFHRAVLPSAIERAGGSVQRAAEQLGIGKASLYRMLQEMRGEGEDGSEP